MRKNIPSTGRILILAVVILIVAVRIACAVEVDSYVDRDYDFSQMKRLYIWPTSCENVPENVKLSIPNLIEDWTKEILTDRKNLKFTPLVKSTEQMWHDIQFIKGQLDFDDPFESDDAASTFNSLLSEACEGVLAISVSVTQERRWQEPRVEYYTVTERVRRVERRMTPNDGWEDIETYIDMPVTKERVIPGRWLVDTHAEGRAELYDTRRPNGRYVAAARSEVRDTRGEDESARAARDTAGKALSASLKSIFHK